MDFFRPCFVSIKNEEECLEINQEGKKKIRKIKNRFKINICFNFIFDSFFFVSYFPNIKYKKLYIYIYIYIFEIEYNFHFNYIYFIHHYV